MPEHCLDESVRVIRSRIADREGAGVLDAETAAVLRTEGESALRAAVTVIPAAVYGPREADAQQRLEGHCALDDWPSVALALALGGECDGIWTDDRDYFGTGVAIWSTDALRRVLSSLSWDVVIGADPSASR